MAVENPGSGCRAASERVRQEWPTFYSPSSFRHISLFDGKYGRQRSVVRFEVEDLYVRPKVAEGKPSVAIIATQIPELCLKGQTTQSFSLRLQMGLIETLVEEHWGILGREIWLALQNLEGRANKGQCVFVVVQIEDLSREGLVEVSELYLYWDKAVLSMMGSLTGVEWKAAMDCVKWILSVSGKPSRSSESGLRTKIFRSMSQQHSALPRPVHAVVPEPIDKDFGGLSCEVWRMEDGVDLKDHNPGFANTCWVSLFSSGTVGMVVEPDWTLTKPSVCGWMGKGMKIPFDLMIHIAGVDQLIEAKTGTPILTGFRTALIPIALLPDGSVQWHFIAAKPENSLRFRSFHDRPEFDSLLPPSSERLTNISIEELKGTAYLGWSQDDIDIVLGSQDPPLPIPKSCLSRITTCCTSTGRDFQGGVQVMPVSFLTLLLSTTQKYSINDLRCKYVPAEVTESLIDEMFANQVIIYEDDKKTAYLLPLIHLVVALVRAYLKHNDYKYDQTLLAFPKGITRSQGAIRKLQSMPVEAGNEDYKYEDVFKTIIRRYSSLNAGLPTAERCTASKLLAFEVAHILYYDAPFCPRTLSIDNCWNSIAQSTDALFCGSLGEMIVHRRAASVRPCLLSPPIGYNILICPLPLLKRHFDSMDRQNCYRQKGRDDVEWVINGLPFGPCIMGERCDGRHDWSRRLQRIISLGAVSKRLKAKTSSHTLEKVSLDGDGALCFGRMSVAGPKSKVKSPPEVHINGATNLGEDLHSARDQKEPITTVNPRAYSREPNGVQI